MTRIIESTRKVKVQGETLTLGPLGFGQLPALVGLVDALAEQFGGQDVDFVKLLTHGGEALFDVLVLATGKPREWFDTITDYSEAVELVTAVYELNREQIVKNLLPALAPLLTKVQAPATKAATKAVSRSTKLSRG